MSLWLKWDITYKCNLMCEHCINGDYLDNSNSEINLEEFIHIIENIDEKIPIDGISFLGGEPIVHKDFIDILRYLNKKQIHFGFNSNGLLLNERNLNEVLCLEFLDNIVLSLEGPDPLTNDQIRGKKVFNTIISRIKSIHKYKQIHKECKTKITINFVATSHNFNKIDEMIDLCINHNIDSLNILEFIEEGNGVGKGLSTSIEQNFIIINTIANRYSSIKDKLEITPKFVRPLAIDYVNKVLHKEFPTVNHGCGAGASFAFLDNKGNIYPCDRERNLDLSLRGKYSLLDNTFESIWLNEKFVTPFSKYYSDSFYERIKPCNQCKYLKKECYPCHLLINPNIDTEMTMCRMFKEELDKCESND